MRVTAPRHDNTEQVGRTVHDRRLLLAKAVTEVFAPTVVLAAGYLIVTAVTAPTLREGLLWGTVAVSLGSVLPFLFIVAGVRSGRLSDHHIRVRAQRHVPLAVALGGVVSALAVLAVLHAGRPLLVLMGLVAAVLAPCMAITVWWQISVHTGIAAVTAAVLIALCGPWLMLIGVMVTALGWSRVVLRAHTVAQVWAGAALGTAIGVLAWPLLG